jgi:hypothetical protein
MLNSELSIVRSARQYKTYKNEVKRWSDIVNLVSIVTIIFSTIFLIIGILELVINSTPLFVKLSMLVFKNLGANNPPSN